MSKTNAAAPSAPAPHPEAEPTETVVLTADHEHGGVPHKAGDKLTVPRRVADWLRANGVVGQAPATEQA